MIPTGQLTGAVLAGGHSRRMGTDKALLMSGGQPLWRRQLELLHAAGATSVGIVRRADQPALPLPAAVSLWLDAVTDVGPLAGLHAALSVCPTAWLAVVAVDLPRLDTGWFTWLAESCAPGCGAIARHADGAFEPLAAIYPRSALTEVAARIHGPDLSLQGLATVLVARGQLAGVPLPETARWRVENWNAPADTEAVADRRSLPRSR